MILSMDGSSPSFVDTNWRGKVLCKIVYFCLTNPMTLSTCIRTLAIDLVSSTSSGESWLLPLVKAGICNFVRIAPTDSAITNPRSAS